MKHLFYAAAALIAMAPLSGAHANEIVNGGFESGTLGLWFTSGSAFFSVGDNLLTPDGTKAVTVGFASPFDPGFGTISQSFSTATAGQYSYRFLLGRGDGGGFADYGLFFDANIDGTVLSTVVPPLVSCCGPQQVPFTSFEGSLFLGAGAHQINFNFARSFTLFGRSPFFVFDGVSVQALNAGVPEPASWAMMVSGFGLAGAAARRRARGSAIRFGHPADMSGSRPA